METMSLEELLQKTESRYGLVLAAAARANELVSGEPPYIKTMLKKASSIALEEMMRGNVSFKITDKKQSKSKSDKTE